MKTITGRDVSITAAFRLPIQDYQKAQELAESESVKLSVVLRRLVVAGLAAQQKQGKEAQEVTTR